MKIGPTFAAELKAAGISGDGLAWGDDGKVEYREDVSKETRGAVEAVLAAHDPSLQPVSKAGALIATCDAIMDDVQADHNVKQLAAMLKEYLK